jgi:hypothetical protein
MEPDRVGGRVRSSSPLTTSPRWLAVTYNDLRRTGPDRGARIRGVLDTYMIPSSGPQTKTMGDTTYFMVHEWILMLVGRQPREETDTHPKASEVADSKIGGEHIGTSGPWAPESALSLVERDLTQSRPIGRWPRREMTRP